MKYSCFGGSGNDVCDMYVCEITGTAEEFDESSIWLSVMVYEHVVITFMFMLMYLVPDDTRRVSIEKAYASRVKSINSLFSAAVLQSRKKTPAERAEILRKAKEQRKNRADMKLKVGKFKLKTPKKKKKLDLSLAESVNAF